MRSRGFTLVEMAIALAVIAMGLASLVPLFSDSFLRIRALAAETRATNFAADVFATLRVVAESHQRGSTNENAWVEIWEDIANGARPAPTPWLWHDLDVFGDGRVYALVFSNAAGLVSHAFRYDLEILPPTGSINRAEATLRVWEGAVGSTNEALAFAFHSEFYRDGAPP